MCRPTRTRIGPDASASSSPRRRECSRSRRKSEEEGVALSVDLDAVVAGAGLADQAPVLSESFGVPLRSQFVQELRRALDVGEEEGDGAGR